MKNRNQTAIIDRDWELPLYDKFEFQRRQTKYCVGIPIINEGDKFKNQLILMKKISTIADILIFDGGSNDGSTDKKFLKNQNVRTLLTLRSQGKHGAQLLMGFAYALKEGYKGIITIDGNGKDNPEAIYSFVEGLNEGFDFVQGSRFVKGGKAINTPLLRLLAIRLVHAPLFSLCTNYWYTDTTNGFRAYSRNYLLHPKVKPFRSIFTGYELYLYLTIRAHQLGLKTKEIPVTRRYPRYTVPTKITGLKNYIDFLTATVKVAMGVYHPKLKEDLSACIL